MLYKAHLEEYRVLQIKTTSEGTKSKDAPEGNLN